MLSRKVDPIKKQIQIYNYLILLQEIREGKAPVNVELILDAGHHVYADSPQRFNTLLTNACNMFDDS